MEQVGPKDTRTYQFDEAVREVNVAVLEVFVVESVRVADLFAPSHGHFEVF